jgi:hypothetical protein
MRNLTFAGIALLFAACTIQPSRNPTEQTGGFTGKDTLHGVTGADSAKFARIDERSHLFSYPSAVVEVLADPERVGEFIRVLPRGEGKTIELTDPESEAFFYGMAHGHILVDIGSGPDGRIMEVYDLKTGGQVFSATYIGEEMEVTPEGVLKLYVPIDKPASEMPCPQQAEWEKHGLGTGYGQLRTFNLKTHRATDDAEVRCFPLQ